MLLLDLGLAVLPYCCDVWDWKVGYDGRVVVVKCSVEGLKYSPRIYCAIAVRVSQAIVGVEGERE
jgi:hypothetical protein